MSQADESGTYSDRSSALQHYNADEKKQRDRCKWRGEERRGEGRMAASSSARLFSSASRASLLPPRLFYFLYFSYLPSHLLLLHLPLPPLPSPPPFFSSLCHLLSLSPPPPLPHCSTPPLTCRVPRVDQGTTQPFFDDAQGGGSDWRKRHN